MVGSRDRFLLLSGAVVKMWKRVRPVQQYCCTGVQHNCCYSSLESVYARHMEFVRYASGRHGECIGSTLLYSGLKYAVVFNRSFSAIIYTFSLYSCRLGVLSTVGLECGVPSCTMVVYRGVPWSVLTSYPLQDYLNKLANYHRFISYWLYLGGLLQPLYISPF